METNTTDSIANNDIIVKLDIDSEIQYQIINILDAAQGDSIPDLIKINLRELWYMLFYLLIPLGLIII